MQRDAAGKFISNWGVEAKKRVSVTLTNTAWRLLKEEAQKSGISRSEVIERTARSFATMNSCPFESNLCQPKQDTSNNLNCKSSNVDSNQRLDGDRRDICIQSRELILEQQKAFLQFQHQTQELAVFLESAPEAISRFDADLRYLYVNRAAERVLGKARADLLGKTVAEAFSNSIGLFLERNLRWTFATAQEREIEFEFKAQYGVRFYQAWLVPELVTNDKPMSVIVISRDLTETKQAKRQHTQLLANQETYSSRS